MRYFSAFGIERKKNEWRKRASSIAKVKVMDAAVPQADDDDGVSCSVYV